MSSYCERFRERVLLDAFAEALGVWWRHRADVLDAARPRPDDFTGSASHDEIAARDRALSDAAQACRHRASLGLQSGDATAVRAVLDEVMADG